MIRLARHAHHPSTSRGSDESMSGITRAGQGEVCAVSSDPGSAVTRSPSRRAWLDRIVRVVARARSSSIAASINPLAHLVSTMRRKRYRMRRCSHSEAGERASPPVADLEISTVLGIVDATAAEVAGIAPDQRAGRHRRGAGCRETASAAGGAAGRPAARDRPGTGRAVHGRTRMVAPPRRQFAAP